jgi:hypothetical protein
MRLFAYLVDVLRAEFEKINSKRHWHQWTQAFTVDARKSQRSIHVGGTSPTASCGNTHFTVWEILLLIKTPAPTQILSELPTRLIAATVDTLPQKMHAKKTTKIQRHPHRTHSADVALSELAWSKLNSISCEMLIDERIDSQWHNSE